LVEHYRRVRQAHSDGGGEGLPFKKWYMINLLQAMLEDGVQMEAVETHGGYFEIDTTQDYLLAQQGWPIP
jgi:hypothetical protein